MSDIKLFDGESCHVLVLSESFDADKLAGVEAFTTFMEAHELEAAAAPSSRATGSEIRIEPPMDEATVGRLGRLLAKKVSLDLGVPIRIFDCRHNSPASAGSLLGQSATFGQTI